MEHLNPKDKNRPEEFPSRSGCPLITGQQPFFFAPQANLQHSSVSINTPSQTNPILPAVPLSVMPSSSMMLLNGLFPPASGLPNSQARLAPSQAASLMASNSSNTLWNPYSSYPTIESHTLQHPIAPTRSMLPQQLSPPARSAPLPSRTRRPPRATQRPLAAAGVGMKSVDTRRENDKEKKRQNRELSTSLVR